MSPKKVLLPMLVAGLLALTGCAAEPQSASGASPSESKPPESQVPPETPAAPETPLNPVNPADLPDWFPGDLPMPAGDYRWATVDDDGVFLNFTISDEQVILDLVAELEKAGFTVTAVDDHGEGWKTWFTENPEFRANIAARKLATPEAYIDYRIEPK